MHEECLTFTLTSFLTAGWVSERQLLSMVEGLSCRDSEPTSIITLKLLHLNHQQFFSPSSFRDNLAKLLLATAPLARFSSPLHSLATGDLPEFQAVCEKSEDEELRRVGRSAMGLFPQASDGLGSCLYYPRESKQGGNPGWVWARKSLRDYYRLKANKMGSQMREIYDFLLSSEELLKSHASPFRHCWTALYLFYHGQALEEKLGEFADPEAMRTWSTISLEQTFQQLQSTFELLPAQERLPYFLVLNLLNSSQQVASFISCSPLQEAFRLLLERSFRIEPQLQLMLLLFFLGCAQKSQLPGIAEACRGQYRRLLEEKHPQASLYLSFFLPQEEIADNIIALRLSPSQIPAQSSTRQRLYDILLEKGQTYPEGIIQLSRPAIDSHFLAAAKLADTFEGEKLILQASKAADLWVERLALELPFAEREELEQAFIAFLDTWRKYFQFLTGCRLPDLYAALEPGEYLKEFFPYPRTSSDAVFNILMSSVRLFRQQIFHEQVVSEFEREVLPDLLAILPSSKADLFRQEWSCLPSQSSAMPAEPQQE